MNLFNQRLLKQRLNKYDISSFDIDTIKTIVTKWQTALQKSDLDKTKETGVQGQFLLKFFENILGYKTQSEGGSTWNMYIEPKTEVDSREADGSLGFFSSDSDTKDQTRVVIELKDAKTNLDAKQKGRKNQQSPVEQAFDYLSKFDGCKWAIVSNFKEIRLYSKERGQGYYEMIDLQKLDNDNELKRFVFLLSKTNLIAKDGNSIIDDLLGQSFTEEQDISKDFYKHYKSTRIELFEHLIKNNPSISQDVLLEKAQKILDRVIFVCFCEDLELLPNGIFRKLLDAAKISFSPSDTKVWDQAKGLFQSIDKGNPPLDINKFNGGLFAPDEILDNLLIKDEAILSLLKLSEYNFDSDLNVNILGHIFEQSISDLEEMRVGVIDVYENIETGELSEEKRDIRKVIEKTGKRKKDGIFYTPEYITRYIVEQAVGGWLQDRKNELGFNNLPELTDNDYSSVKVIKGRYKGNKKVEQHRKFWEEYKEKLRDIKVLDPACGSGAFLNQVFDYLYKEGQVVNQSLAELKLGQSEIFDLDKHILTSNIYGVDLNEESVQITKLSLWLKTANKAKELTSLDENIKCGNSLVDDPEVAGDKAFKWAEEFKDIISTGGFDVVIGNPPYVRADSPGNTETFRKYLVNNKNFETLSGKWDLYIPFLELGYKLLNAKGYSSFIIPDAYCHANYAQSSVNWFKQKNALKQIDYYPELEVFENVGVKSIIVNYTRDVEGSFVQRIHESKVQYIEKIHKDYPENLRLDATESLISSKNSSLIPFGNICYISVGIVGNSHEKLYKGEFKVSELLTSTKDEIHSRLYYEGKDIDKYSLVNKRWIEYGTDRSPKKWRRKGFKEFFEGSPKIVAMRSPGYTPRFLLDLENGYFNESAIGFKRWIDLKGVNNLSLKNTYKDTETREKYEEISNEFEYEYLLAILNSELTKYELNTNRRSNIHIYPEDYKTLPIPKANKETQKEFKELVTELITLLHNLVESKSRFLEIIQDEYKLERMTKALQEWYSLDWSGFINEIEKQNTKLNLNQKEELNSVFNQRRAKLLEITSKVKEIEMELNNKVNEVYELSNEQINLIKTNGK